MAKLNLIIADSDKFYAESLVRYLRDNHSQKFRISSFTEKLHLYNYLCNKGTGTDILLISPRLYDDSFDFTTVRLPVILSEGRLESGFEGLVITNKYQTADKLISSILNTYAELYPEEQYINSGDKKTKVIAVYSSIGGVGKTTVAIALAAELSGKGKNVFYLNLENTQSTPAYFEDMKEQSLTDILYFIRSKSKTIALKIEAVKQVDINTKIHYFSTPESILDFEETRPEELQYLISQLRDIGKYDVVVVDLSCSLDSRNIAVLDSCDRIILLSGPGYAAEVKLQALLKALQIIDVKMKGSFLAKSLLVHNKSNSSNRLALHENQNAILPIACHLPRTSNLQSITDGKCLINMDGAFGSAIRNLADSLYGGQYGI